MPFDERPIGIGNLVNLKKRATAAGEVLKKVPTEAEPARATRAKDEGGEDVAQLSVDVYETNDELIIIAPLAGVATADVRIEITDDVVVIEGERSHPLEGLVRKDEMLVQECYFGAFSRSIVLPEAVDSRKAKAEFQKSVLIVRLPKLDNVRTRIIRVEEK